MLCCSSFFNFVCTLLSNILSVYYCMWTSYVNVTILQRNDHAYACSQYQAVSLLPRSLGTRLMAHMNTQHAPILHTTYAADLVYRICVLCSCRWFQWKCGCWGSAGGKRAEEGSACGSHPAWLHQKLSVSWCPKQLSLVPRPCTRLGPRLG